MSRRISGNSEPGADRNDFLRRLRDALARTFSSVKDAEWLAFDAGLDRANIDWSGSAQYFWGNVLDEAEKAGLTNKLLNIAADLAPGIKELQSLWIEGIRLEEERIRTRDAWLYTPVRDSSKRTRRDLKGRLESPQEPEEPDRPTYHEEEAVGNLQLHPADKRRISAALEAVFTTSQLQQLVADYIPSVARAVPQGDTPIEKMAFAVREEAVRQNLVDQLLRAAVEMRPYRPDLRALVLDLSQRSGWGMLVTTHSLDIGTALRELEKVTSGPADPFFNIKRLALWMITVERQVCQVRCGQDHGTGFLVGPDLVLTCHHVVESHLSGNVAVEDVQVRFDYHETITGENPADDDAAWIGLNPKWKIPFSRSSTADDTLVGEPAPGELDFALLRLAKRAGLDSPPDEAQPRRWVDVSQDRPLPEAGSAMFVVQHPMNDKAYPPQMPLQIALSTPGYEGVNAQGTRIIYTPSTKKGSSGSPVFDRTLSAVALHHNRGLNKTNRGIPLAKIRAALEPDVRKLLVAPPKPA